MKADLMTGKNENNFLRNKTRKLLYVAIYWRVIIQGVFFLLENLILFL